MPVTLKRLSSRMIPASLLVLAIIFPAFAQSPTDPAKTIQSGPRLEQKVPDPTRKPIVVVYARTEPLDQPTLAFSFTNAMRVNL